MKTVQELAAEYSNRFETRKRDDGKEFVCLKDSEQDKDETLTELIRSAHGDMFPDDWKYDFVLRALYAIADAEDDSLEDCEIEPDIYNHDLLEWLPSNAHRWGGYAEDAIGEGATTITDACQWGQANEIREVYDSVLASLREIVESRGDDASEEEGGK